ncbi:MAG: periplasmic heavy metal sensor [Desulfobacterales bacterium]|nr:periplasmic heavy metal sensor [Desulfobacterales bacterium]
MKKNLFKLILGLMVLMIIGLAGNVFAEGGMGYGPGWHHRAYGETGYTGNLTDQEIKALETERNAFLKDTEGNRQQIYQKELDLKSELAKENPDAQKAAQLQKEISDLEAKLNQKLLDHVLRMRKISPNVGQGFMGGGPMGPGAEQNRISGAPDQGGWNYCPYCGRSLEGGGYGMGPGMMGSGYGTSYGMMGSGYGMGPGMMGGGYGTGSGMMGGGYGTGSGMMGGGYGTGSGMMGGGYGKGSGWMGRGPTQGGRTPQTGSQYRQGQGPLSESDAKSIVENYLASNRNPNLKIGKIKDAGNAFEAEILTKENALVDKVLIDKSSGWMRSAY